MIWDYLRIMWHTFNALGFQGTLTFVSAIKAIIVFYHNQHGGLMFTTEHRVYSEASKLHTVKPLILDAP